MSGNFKIICSVLLLEYSSFMGWATSASKEDKPSIPPDLYYELKAVPAEENAIINWRRAAEIEVALNENEKQAIKYCWTPAARGPSSDELNDLKGWLTRNSEALSLFNESLKKPKAQWPERNPQNVQPELKALPLMIRARLFEADQLAQQNNFEAAVKSLEVSLKITQAGVEGDAALINYLISCSARSLTQDAILRFAGRKQVPASLLTELLDHLPSLNLETNIYDRVLRVEFTRDYNASIDLPKLAQDWSKMPETNAALSLFPDDCRRPLKVLLDPSLVALHPKPIDWNSEIEKSVRHYRIHRDNTLTPWTERNGEVELDEEENHTNLLQDVAALMELVKNDYLPLNRQAAQKARTAYLAIQNPVGRILDCSITGFIGSDLKVFRCRTEREAARAVLALIIFERRKGQLPATLAELVQAKILDAVPIDPFCGAPLNYSREKRKVWSVNDDGVDDHGAGGKSRWYEKDAVWDIPEIN